MYFQATHYESSDDDIGTTAMVYLDLTHKNIYIDTAVEPFDFGVMDWVFVPIVA